MRRLCVSVVWILSFVFGPLPVASAQTGLPWRASFETNNFSEFNGGARAGLTVISSGCLSGRCARAPLIVGTISDNYADKHFGDFFNVGLQKVEEIYARAYVKIDPPYLWPNESQKLFIFNLTDGINGDRRYQVFVYVNPQGHYDITHSDIGAWRFYGLRQNIGSPVSARLGQWDKLKLHVRLNTPGQSNGVVRLWVNDVMKASYSNVNIRAGTSYGINKFIMSCYVTDTTLSAGSQYLGRDLLVADRSRRRRWWWWWRNSEPSRAHQRAGHSVVSR